MRFLLVAILTTVTSCSTMSEQINKGLCLKWTTFIQEEQECVGGRGVAQQVCVVRYVPKAKCLVWEWPEGRPENGSDTSLE